MPVEVIEHIPWAERAENKAARLVYMRDWRKANPLKACVQGLVTGARSRAKKNGTPFDLDALTVENVMRLVPPDMACPCCSRVMIARVDEGRDMRSITLDKIVNARGYVAGNVAVICALCNQRKRDMTASELRTIADYIERGA